MRNKALFIVWCVFVVIIFGLLSTLGFIYKNKLKTYHEYEDKLIVASKKYIKDNDIFLKDGTSKKISINKLEKSKLITKKDIVKECSGYVLVKKDKLLDYKPVLKCKYYKSK